jgi:hypothetical protein
VERNPVEGNVFLSGSKDGLVIVWTLGTMTADKTKVEKSDKVSEADLIKFQEDVDFK